MTYHAHPSPNSITPFSLYTTEKPEWKPEVQGVVQHDIVTPYSHELNEWQTESHLAYLQEPEWKVGDIGYKIKTGQSFIVVGIQNSLLHYSYNLINSILPNFNTHSFPAILMENASHFHPGQKIDPKKVSYVRKVGYYNDEIIMGKTNSVWRYKWQPALEPEKRKQIPLPYKNPQTPLSKLVPNPLHAQWLTDKSEGTILAVVKLNI